MPLRKDPGKIVFMEMKTSTSTQIAHATEQNQWENCVSENANVDIYANCACSCAKPMGKRSFCKRKRRRLCVEAKTLTSSRLAHASSQKSRENAISGNDKDDVYEDGA